MDAAANASLSLSLRDAMSRSSSMLRERRYFPDNRNQLHPGRFFQGAGESRGAQMAARPRVAMAAEEHKAHLMFIFLCKCRVVQQEMTSQGHLIGEMQSQSRCLTGFSDSLHSSAGDSLSFCCVATLVSLTWLLHLG